MLHKVAVFSIYSQTCPIQTRVNSVLDLLILYFRIILLRWNVFLHMSDEM
jgi:hypothetical protein